VSPTETPTPPPSGSSKPTRDPNLAPWIRQGIGVGSVRALHNERGPEPGHDRRALRRQDHRWRGWTPNTNWGTYSTKLLDTKARKLRKRHVPQSAILTRVYTPFIVEGPATWSDSWHAPRFAGGFHLHEGQDVLCRYGAPVLAAIDGRLTFGENTLGGLAAYIVRPNGSFLYYAHLSRQRTALTDTQVHPGDVIGHCGATGDATVPHVHFSMYDGQDVAHDPMRFLVGLLHDAEGRSVGHHSKPNLNPRLPKSLSVLEDPPPAPSSQTLVPVQPAVNQAGVGIDGRAGLWDVLVLFAALALILAPAGLMRFSKVRRLVGVKDEEP
jgi:murein DD-endopeptidase MepM/ murein hydrolase activator NlpD